MTQGAPGAAVFVVARNPQEDTRLSYLVRLPLEGGLALKARAPWPATAHVYCHRFEQPWPQDAEIIEQTPVRLFRRRGAAIDLALDRPRLSRSQFVFTQVKGREAIFWHTQKTARAANPGGRIPRRRALDEPVTITVDTRERYPYRFSQQGAETARLALAADDNAVQAADGSVLAVVERKTLEDLAAALSDGTLAFQLQRLAEPGSPRRTSAVGRLRGAVREAQRLREEALAVLEEIGTESFVLDTRGGAIADQGEDLRRRNPGSLYLTPGSTEFSHTGDPGKRLIPHHWMEREHPADAGRLNVRRHDLCIHADARDGIVAACGMILRARVSLDLRATQR